MAIAAIHILFGLTGVFFLYLGLALTETEEGKLQNRLEDLWVRIDDLQSAAISRQAAFLKQLSALSGAGLNKLFGDRLFSKRSIVASLWFSIASMTFYWIMMIVRSNPA